MVNAKRLKNQCIDLFKMEEDILGYEQMVLEHYKAALEPYETIALWGTGADGRLLYDFIEEVVKDKDIFFIDNEKSRWNKPNYKILYIFFTVLCKSNINCSVCVQIRQSQKFSIIPSPVAKFPFIVLPSP